ncbi:MAG: EAL domain-containing protein [Pseudomonadota bacterium]
MINNCQLKEHILIVDDDPAVGILAEAALADETNQISIASDGEAALRILESTPPSLLLLDVVMPVKDGFEVCQELLDDSNQHQFPIIMITGLDDEQSIERAYQLGVTGFITKPINWLVLKHQIQFVLRAWHDRQALSESKERYSLAARGANDGLWDWNIKQGYVYFSPRWLEMLGYQETELNGNLSNWIKLIHPEDRELFKTELDSHVAGHSEKFELEYRIQNHQGRYRWMLCRGLAIHDQQNTAYRMAGSQTDISEQKSAEFQLMHDALHDILTGLPNRSLLMERISYNINLLQRNKTSYFALAFLDLDRFKTINDSLGHHVGDLLLQEVGKRIRDLLRDTDLLARIGGDEFVILFSEFHDLQSLISIVERVRRKIALPFTIQKDVLRISASIGISVSEGQYSQPEDILRDADIAMYRAKESGKNRFEIFNPGMHQRASRVLSIESALHDALEKNELRIHYQPIYKLKKQKLVGFEALLRWQHPKQGLLMPQDFLEIAEDSGLIVPLGRWAITQAVEQIRKWRSSIPQLKHAYVSINLSSKEFSQNDLFEYIDNLLKKSELPAGSLKLEITETVLIDNFERALTVMTALRDRGIDLSIDDFGTGFSSLSYLHNFPFDTLKIDQAFVRKLDKNSNSLSIVKAIITLAHNLGLSVVAEGGETTKEIECLRRLGCEYGQGFKFALPQSAEEVVLAL